MIMRRSDDANCPLCGAPLLYGVSDEPDGWTVHIECFDTGCGREFSAGRISRSKIAHLDDVFREAHSRCLAL